MSKASSVNMGIIHATVLSLLTLGVVGSPTKRDSASPIAERALTWNALGCYTDNVSGRALPNGGQVAGGTTAMTVELCESACSAAGYTIAGLEYAGECWCGNTVTNGGGPAPDGSTGCNMPCKGNSAEICGGSNRLSVYSSTSSTSTGTTTGKRGLAYTNAAQANLMKGYPKITWGYNWGYPSNGLDSSLEFVPMLWGLPSGPDAGWDAAVKSPGTKNVLTFNEPDLSYDGSSNIHPAAAAAGWPAYLEPYAGTVGISLPNVLYNREMPGQFNPWVSQGLTWDLQFEGNCTSNPAGSCHSDFAGIHIYTECSLVTEFQGNVTQAWNVLRKPIWITELSCSGSDSEVITFLRAVMPWLDAQSFVARYAYFGVFNTVAGGTPFLLNSDGTGLSDLGMVYATE